MRDTIAANRDRAGDCRDAGSAKRDLVSHIRDHSAAARDIIVAVRLWIAFSLAGEIELRPGVS